MHVERISAVTIRVTDMKRSVRFYQNIFGMKLLYGGEDSSFSTLRSRGKKPSTLNLERGSTTTGWGRLIFHVADVDAFWAHLKKSGIDGEEPRNATWGERYFHLHDPDGHEVSIAQPLP